MIDTYQSRPESSEAGHEHWYGMNASNADQYYRNALLAVRSGHPQFVHAHGRDESCRDVSRPCDCYVLRVAA